MKLLSALVLFASTQWVWATLSDQDLKRYSEELFAADDNNVYKHLTLDRGGRIPFKEQNVDHAPDPLIGTFDAARHLNTTTFRALTNFYNNYISQVNEHEKHTEREHFEQVFFINEIMKTRPMRIVHEVLVKNGYAPRQEGEFKKALKTLWFDFYGRDRGINGSSGFEHVLLGEIRKGAVSGFHNWVYFYFLEQKDKANYLGYKKFLILGQRRAAAIKFSFKWQTHLKPVTSMLVGTSPELELALYLLCFHARRDGSCPIQLGGKQLTVKTHSYRNKGKTHVGSAYVDL